MNSGDLAYLICAVDKADLRYDRREDLVRELQFLLRAISRKKAGYTIPVPVMLEIAN